MLTRSKGWADFDNSFRDMCARSLDLFDAVDRNMTMLQFPNMETHIPYNTLRTDNGYRVELALAGFTKDEIKVSSKGNILSVVAERKEKESATEILTPSGEVSSDDTISRNYVHRGIAMRTVYKQVAIPKGAKVGRCKFENGLLCIDLDVQEKQDNTIEYEVE